MSRYSHCRRMLTSPAPWSTRPRSTLIECARNRVRPTFFAASPIHTSALQSLRKEQRCCPPPAPILPCEAVHKQIRHLLECGLLLLRDLDRMHLELRPQLAQALRSPNCLHHHPRLEGRAMLLPCRRHQPLPVNDLRPLAYCLVQIPGSAMN